MKFKFQISNQNVIARSGAVARRSRSKLGDSSLRSEQAPQFHHIEIASPEPALSNKTRFLANARNDKGEGARNDRTDSDFQTPLRNLGLIFFLMLSLFFTPTFSPVVSAAQGYVIGDEDVLNIMVWGSPELGVQVPVRPDGMISVPLVGDVMAAGVTPHELKTVLEGELSKFVKAPTVSVIVMAVNSFKVYVLGEGVTTPGAITLKRNATLMQFFAQLGTLKSADLNNSYVLRDGQKLSVDLYKLAVKGDVSQDILLKPNDIIFIPDDFEMRIKVVGAVNKPGIIQYREGLTALDAILNSGGFTEFAKQNDVIVVRKEGSELKNIVVRLKDVIKDGDISKDLPLKPGDLIIVKTGIF